MVAALSGSPSTAVTWTAPETQTQGLPLTPRPANPPSLHLTQTTGMMHYLCVIFTVSVVLFFS